MKTFSLLFLLSGTVFGYEQPKVAAPDTMLSKLGHLISFKDMDVNLQGTNNVNLTRNFTSNSRVKVEGYGRYNLAQHVSESGLRVKLKW